GVSGNFSFYQQDYSFNQDGSLMIKMVDYDIAAYVQGHLFGYKAFLDPFVELGLGRMATDYANKDDDPDPDNPLLATNYWQIGAGLGLNFGAIGIFGKVLYMTPFGSPAKGTMNIYDVNGNVTGQTTYDLARYPLKKLKVFLGGKLIL
ncbi:MAG TPA: hypothetical protein VMC79_02680, partial [Rectinemataceae bacterium]|nr:hypothetical protein [Rectinemataceae bacterium]